MESDGTVMSWFKEGMTENMERASGVGNQDGLMKERRSQSGKVEKWCVATLFDGD